MRIIPWIQGSGRAGHAIEKALACLALNRPELGLERVQWLPRETDYTCVAEKSDQSLLIIANPHALHASSIFNASRAGVRNILSEKPACVNLEQIKTLRGIQARVGVFHVYRQMWGPQTLKKMLSNGALGEIITIEGRYWQSSSADRALQSLEGAGTPSGNWKNDERLGGAADTLIDIATHWADLASHLFGAPIQRVGGWISYQNAETQHRDSHVQLMLDYVGGGRAMGSISKTIHGATNHFEINVIGTRKSATWQFLNPDEILIGEGRNRRVVVRTDRELGSGLPPFHTVGWLEGYIEIASQAIDEMFMEKSGNYPRLEENLDLLESLLSVDLSR